MNNKLKDSNTSSTYVYSVNMTWFYVPTSGSYTIHIRFIVALKNMFDGNMDEMAHYQIHHNISFVLCLMLFVIRICSHFIVSTDFNLERVLLVNWYTGKYELTQWNR